MYQNAPELKALTGLRITGHGLKYYRVTDRMKAFFASHLNRIPEDYFLIAEFVLIAIRAINIVPMRFTPDNR